MRIMIGIGTPISQSRQERMVSPIKKHFPNAGEAKEVPARVKEPRNLKVTLGRGPKRAVARLRRESIVANQRPRRPAVC